MTVHDPIVISAGHSKKCIGAVGYIDEYTENVRVVERVYDILKAAGVGVKKFIDTTSTTQDANLYAIVDYHNAQTRDLDVSVHFNATAGAYGTECWYVSQEALADEVSAAVARAGSFTDRGPKYDSKGLYFLRNTEEPAILIEVCFVDSKSDTDKYKAKFEEICQAIATTIAGKKLAPGPTPPDPGPDPTPDIKPRPVIALGDYGNNVREVQARVGATVDGDFGKGTESAVVGFQRVHGLGADGVVGSETWAALDKERPLPSYPPPLPPKFDPAVLNRITYIAGSSPIASYSWRDRGVAPAGHIKGMAVAYAQAVLRFNAGDPIMLELAKANTHNDEKDALSWYNSNFQALGMSNEVAGLDVLRHLYVLMTGLAMRESAGKFCEGRDMSADNVQSDTCEAGLLQTSWNASNCCTDFLNEADMYDKDSPQGYMSVFAEEVSCSSSSWACYGSGDGLRFQETCKYSPVYAVETCGLTLRNLRTHYGPIGRKEAELRSEADAMLKRIEDLVRTLPPWSIGTADV
jgi:hypothetical protein